MENSVVSQVIPTSKGFSTHPYRPDDRTSDISLRTGRLKSPKRPPKDPNPLVHPHRSQKVKVKISEMRESGHHDGSPAGQWSGRDDGIGGRSRGEPRMP